MITLTEQQLLDAGIQPLPEEVISEMLLSSSTMPFDQMLMVAGSVDLRPGEPTPASKTMPGVNWSPKVNWVEKLGGLPPYIRRIAKQLLYRQGMTRQRAIATAINTVKKWCAAGSNESGINVKPDIRAQACAAVAAWEKMKAGARVIMSTPEETMEQIMSDKEAFALFGMQWPDDLPEYWNNPQASDEYMEKFDQLFPETNEEETDADAAEGHVREGSSGEQEPQVQERDNEQGDQQPRQEEREVDSGERGNVGEQREREESSDERNVSESGGQAEHPGQRVEGREQSAEDSSEQAADEQAAGRDSSEAEAGERDLELATTDFSTTPWSNFKESDYTDEQYKRAALIESPGEGYIKGRCKLPVREPNGKLNWNGVQAAASRINQTQAPEALKKKAARTLVRFYRMAGKEPPENVRRLAGMDLSTETDVAVRTPWDIGNVDKVTKKMYWKQIIPKGRMLYQGNWFDWNNESMDLAVTNFKKGVFDAVPFVLVNKDDGSHPVQDIEATRGVMLDMQRRSDGLYGLFQVDDRADMVLSASDNQLGVSPKVLFNYYREWDDTVFDGPVIEHVAATFHPRRNGQKPWQVAELSTVTTTDNVVDLSGGEWKPLGESEGKGGDPDVADNDTGQQGQGVNTVSSDSTTQQQDQDQPQTMQLANGQTAQVPEGMMLLSKEEYERGQNLLQEATEQANRNADRAIHSVRRSEVEGEISQYKAKGVPYFVLELARPLLMEDNEESPELEYMELSVTEVQGDGGEKEQKTVPVKAKGARGDIIRKILDGFVGTMELSGNGGPSERGSQETETPAEDNPDDAQARHDTQYKAYLARIGEGG